MNSYFTDEQVEQLLWPVRTERVSVRDGMSHMEAYDVRAHLTRVLGFARWSGDLLSCDLLFEELRDDDRDPDPKPWKRRVFVGYRATYRLTVCAPDGTVLATYTEAATGDASNFPITKRADAHDFAIKTAESQAMKRCAVNLGDAYGASLYRKGSTAPLVRAVFAPKAGHITPEGMVWKRAGSADEHIDTQLPSEDETPGPAPVVSDSQAATVEKLRGDIARAQARGRAS